MTCECYIVICNFKFVRSSSECRFYQNLCVDFVKMQEKGKKYGQKHEMSDWLIEFLK